MNDLVVNILFYLYFYVFCIDCENNKKKCVDLIKQTENHLVCLKFLTQPSVNQLLLLIRVLKITSEKCLEMVLKLLTGLIIWM
jgi:hypothetical protein